MYKYLILFSVILFPYSSFSQMLDSLLIESEYLREVRKINIWTPKGYQENEDKYPVVYLLDGGMKEDFPHVQESIQKLIEENKIPPIVLVGIENTNRRRDFTGTTNSTKDKKLIPQFGGSAEFRLFLKNELILFIQKRYRVSEEKSIMGESLAGLFIVETFLMDPQIFQNYLAYDPSLWWNKAYLVKEFNSIYKSQNYNQVSLWYAGSSAKDIQKNTRMLAQKLNDTGANALNWKYSDEPQEKHNTIFKNCKEKSLIWALNKH